MGSASASVALSGYGGVEFIVVDPFTHSVARHTQSQHRTLTIAGNVLVSSLVVSGTLGFVLAGYLTLVGYQHKASMRSTAWNAALPLAEAGIEEAMSQINANGTNLVANNDWSLVDDKYFQKWRTIGEDRYLAGFMNTYPPILISQGFTRLPLKTNLISRTVVVRTRLHALFDHGMLARQNIDLGGNKMEVDSFNSSDPAHSTNGLYDPSKRNDNGTIVTNSTLTNSLNTGNATIRGKIATGPGGVPKIGANGAVGSSSWIDAGNTGLQPTAFTDDSNVSVNDVTAPFASALPPVGGKITSLLDGTVTTYDYILTDGNWMISSPLKFGGKVLVTGRAVLLVTSDVAFSGQDFIKIQTGASLQLYVSAPTATISGQGVQNETGNALNFIYYGLPSNTTLKYSGNSALIGTIYAPQADFTLGGGGNDTYDFIGASVTKSVTMNGHFNFHYDEGLQAFGPNAGWIAVSWDETATTWADIRAKSLGPSDL